MIKSNKDRMIAGEFYHADDPILAQERLQARCLLYQLNQVWTGAEKEKQEILDQLLGSHQKAVIEQGFLCDYGYNIFIGSDFYAHFNCTILDVCPVHIGNHCTFGANVHIYTAAHPLDVLERRRVEYGKSVIIGNNCWIESQTIILPGVIIGEDVVITAGSVVSKNIPSNVKIGGSPAKILEIRPSGLEKW